MKTYFTRFLLMIFMTTFLMPSSCRADQSTIGWPEITSQTKPWTRWWWQGSAVTKKGITAELQSLKDKGFGGVEITPVYGVHGHESEFIDYLSDEWMGMLIHTLKEADRLGLGVDMATGTGWPFGGPWVSPEDACKNLVFNTCQIDGGKKFTKKVSYVQPSMVDAVGDRTFQNSKERAKKTSLTIDQLKKPLAANENLQSLALAQIRFEESLPIVTVMAYSDAGEIVDLQQKIDDDGQLSWQVPVGKWTVYELFQGWHGKIVERAAPGGEGDVIDHFSEIALARYLARFDYAFKNSDISSLRAFFNDSYEVDDAKGAADWTPHLFEEFQKRRGYDLKRYLPALLGKDEQEINERILCDYRMTISELVEDHFTLPWKTWAHQHQAIVRNQAHGAPANILDLYAQADIPETEGAETLRIKMASSASNVTGKFLTSAESATWLNEHFQSNLADIKQTVDNYFLNGINHIVYHGTAYSPDDAEWPGWLFYAAAHVNDRNPLWRDIASLNGYIARSQSFLQQGQTDNDVLLYFPIYDRFSTPGKEMIEHFNGLDKRYDGTVFKHAAEEMLAQGYAFDYISDKQILNLTVKDTKILSADHTYQVIMIPACKYIPLNTIEKIKTLAAQGAKVIFLGGLPANSAGFAEFENNEKAFHALINDLKWQQIAAHEEMKLGSGQVYKADDLQEVFHTAGIRRESMVDIGLSFIRKQEKNVTTYFINNTSDQKLAAWVTLETPYADAIIYNPMDEKFGKAMVKTDEAKTTLYLQLLPLQSLIVQIGPDSKTLEPYAFFTESIANELTGRWQLNFTEIGPYTPPSVVTDTLCSWTNFSGPSYPIYSGTVKYELTFIKPEKLTTNLKLDLGLVKESAQVMLNGHDLGTLIGPDFSIHFNRSILMDTNNLVVHVSNKMANRIVGLDQQGVFWKKFYNVNFPPKFPENQGANRLFSAARWAPMPSGLFGPVRLINLEQVKNERLMPLTKTKMDSDE